MDEKKTYLVNVESNLKKYADEAAEAKKKVDELKASNDALKQSGEATTAEIEASNAALRNAQKEYNQAKKMVDLQTAANKSEIGSRKQLGEILKLQEQELGKLGKAYITNAQGMRVLNPLYIEQRNRIAETKKAIIDYDQSLNDGRSNIGRYGESVEASFKSIGSSMLSAVAPAALLMGALNKLKEAFLDTELGAKITKQWAEGIKTFFQTIITGQINMAGANALVAADIAKKMDDLRKGDREDIINIAKLETELNDIRLKGADVTKTITEQLKYQNLASEKENELIDYKIKDRQEELDLINLMRTVRPEDTNLMLQAAQIEADIITIKGEHLLRLEQKKSSLRLKEKELIDKEIADAEKKEVADEIAGQRNYERLKKEQTNKGKLVEKDKKEQMGLFDMFKKLQKETADIVKETNKDLGDSDTILTNMKLDNQELIRDSLFNGLDAMISIVGQQTEAGKAFAVAQATIDTFGAANKALNDPTIPSTIARVLIMASIILKGIANVKQILSVKVSKGSASVPSAPTAITSTPAVEKTYAASVGSSFATQPQLSQSQLNAVPNQSLLTADDIARALSKMPAPIVTVEDINAKINQVNKVKVRADI